MSAVIGITGHMGAGKDAVASLLVDEYGYTRIGFADGVKALALASDPVVDAALGLRLSVAVERIGWDRAKREVPEVREYLQRLGHAARQVIGSSVWIDALAAEVIRLARPVVIADLRYPNEEREIRRWGGQVWRVNRPGFHGNGHPSEQGVEDITPDMEIDNDGDLDDLRAQVRRLLWEVIA